MQKNKKVVRFRTTFLKFLVFSPSESKSTDLKGELGVKEACANIIKQYHAPHLSKRYSLRSCYFQTPIPLSPFPHGKGGTHIHSFSSYEGAAAAAEGCRNERAGKPLAGFSASFVSARSAPDCARDRRLPHCRKKEFASLMLSKIIPPQPFTQGEGVKGSLRAVYKICEDGALPCKRSPPCGGRLITSHLR